VENRGGLLAEVKKHRGKALREARREAGLTQVELAA
jgi:hypothetical protein